MFKFDWWRDSDNRDGATAIVGLLKIVVPALIVVALGVAGWVGLDFAANDPAPQDEPDIPVGDNSTVQTGTGTQIVTAGDANVVIGLSEDSFLKMLEAREAQIRADLGRANTLEKSILQSQLDTITAQKSDLDAAYDKAVEELRQLRLRLAEFQKQVPRDRLEKAQQALLDGNRRLADELLAEVQDSGRDAVQLAAEAAYLRGDIAAQEIRWADAADHFAEGARLAPDFDKLYNARKFAWYSARYAEALRFGEDLLAHAREHGNGYQLVVALNEHALTLHSIGRYDEAEPLFREVLNIDREAQQDAHPGHATRLNNLANLYRDMGRFDQAEPLYREALQMTGSTLGQQHPDYATNLANLAGLLQATGRADEAEPLYRETLKIHQEALGDRHPDYATGLNNLGTLLRDTGRYDEAEPLYREALEITREVLGQWHPGYAIQLNNLANLLQATGRVEEAEPLYREALAIDREVLGDRHPNTAIDLANLGSLVGERGRLAEGREMLEQALEIFGAKFPEDHPYIAETRRLIAALPNAQD